MVAAQHGRVAAPGGDAVQFVEEVLSGMERSTRPYVAQGLGEPTLSWITPPAAGSLGTMIHIAR